MDIHMEVEAKAHLRLVLRALTVEQNDNDLQKEAMTLAQSRCRKIELKNVNLRRKIDAVKSRMEAMTLTPDQRAMFLALLEMNTEAMESCRTQYLNKVSLRQSAVNRRGKEAKMVNEIKSQLDRLTRDNARAREHLRGLQEQLGQRRQEAKDAGLLEDIDEKGEEEGEKEEMPPVFVMGIPISMTKTRDRVEREPNLCPTPVPAVVTPTLYQYFRKLVSGLDDAWPRLRGTKPPPQIPDPPNKEVRKTLQKWSEKRKKIELVKRAIQRGAQKSRNPLNPFSSR
ncbi:hypothetical protein AAMO2058_001212600 [Amorphochlora amoebiformis]